MKGQQQGIFMKKTIFLSVLFVLTAGLFTGCIDVPDTPYWKDWKITEGYMIKDDDSEQRHFVAYNSSIQDKSHEATLYEHEFIKRPYATLIIQEWNNTEIEYKDVKQNSFNITNKPYELNGFIFYCENDRIYIINTLFNYEAKGKKFKTHQDKFSPADYRFIIEVTGIAEDIKILMDDTGSWD